MTMRSLVRKTSIAAVLLLCLMTFFERYNSKPAVQLVDNTAVTTVVSEWIPEAFVDPSINSGYIVVIPGPELDENKIIQTSLDLAARYPEIRMVLGVFESREGLNLPPNLIVANPTSFDRAVPETIDNGETIVADRNGHIIHRSLYWDLSEDVTRFLDGLTFQSESHFRIGAAITPEIKRCIESATNLRSSLDKILAVLLYAQDVCGPCGAIEWLQRKIRKAVKNSACPILLLPSELSEVELHNISQVLGIDCFVVRMDEEASRLINAHQYAGLLPRPTFAISVDTLWNIEEIGS